MRFFKLTISYDGTNFAGWQFQPGQRTIQATIEKTLAAICGHEIKAVASGRTDAGVHALGQVVSFASSTHHSSRVLFQALNAELPDDVSVLNVEEAPDGFHAIRDATGKRYRYVFDDGPLRDVFRRQFVWQTFRRLDVEAMHRAAQTLRGTHDFSSYESSGAERSSSVRTIRDISVRRLAPPHESEVHLEVEADGFLYNMVRTIVGTLVPIGKGRAAETWPAEVLAARDRRVAGETAPARGLVLLRVDYD
ncbi:MAG: tRNA pseudouridine(38-40) synthase TruA [Planctomycetales bacterium]|nr:tRNA pseudouridine(38-40) synthase TruA [Planctomycetales bacterium]